MDIIKTVKTILLLISIVSLTGCATTGGSGHGSSVLPQSGSSMSQIYNHQYEAGFNEHSKQLKQLRTAGRIPSTDNGGDRSLSSSSRLEHDNNSDQPHRLPNPTITIYVYPHFDNHQHDYVPGHKAYTQLYQHNHFALPGEATKLE